MNCNPDDWNNIAIPLVDAFRLLLKEVYRLGLRSEDTKKSINSINMKIHDQAKGHTIVTNELMFKCQKDLELLDKQLNTKLDESTDYFKIS